MANAEKILCPGCGAEMELAPLADFGLLYGFQYHCPRCGWDSPLMQTEREAREMAARRFDPEQVHIIMDNVLKGLLENAVAARRLLGEEV